MSDAVRGSDQRGVDVDGPADGRPVVFVHGTIFNRTMWAPQRDALSDEYRVITLDLPGHGSRRDESFRLESGIEAVDDVVEELADGGAHVIGLSLGGYVATAYAHRHPENVESLVVSDSSANPVGLLGTLTRLMGKAALLASRTDLAERVTDWACTRFVRSRDLVPAHEAEIIEAGFDLRPYGEAGVEIAGEDFRAAFGAYGGPALVVNGKRDLIMRLGEKEHAAAAGLDSVTVIDGAGHTSNLDRPDEYTSVIERFLAPDASVSQSA